MSHNARAVTEIEVSLIVTRADGTVEDLGVTDYYHRNPLRRWNYTVRKQLKRLREVRNK